MDRFQEIHIEQDFWDDFIVEAFEHIEEIETNAMSLEKNPEDVDLIHTMFRAFHTIKGLSGFVEHTIIQEVAHKTETMMDLCRKGELQVTTKIVDAILKSSDYIKQLCNSTEAYKDEALLDNIEKLLTVLVELAEGEAPAPAPAQEAVQETVAEQQVEPVQEAETAVTEEVQESPEEGLDAFAHEFSEFENPTDTPAEVNESTENASEVEEQKIEAPADEQEFTFEDVSVEESSAQPELEFKEEVVQKTENIENETVVESVVSSDVVKEETVPVEENTEIEFTVNNVETVNSAEKSEGANDNSGNSLVATAEVPPPPPTAEEIAKKSFQNSVLQKLKGNGASANVESSREPGKQASANEEYMKVANYKIDHLVDMMGELIINQALIDQYVALNYNEDRQLVTNMSGFLRITRELQNLSMSLRMVSLKPTFQKITRIARDTIQELGKSVEFVTSGEGTEIDRAVADKLLDPLVHLIKNAISHGVEEKPSDRAAIGKPEKALVELNAYSKRGKIFIEIKDDGRGINTEIVYQKALEKGLVEPNRTYSDAEIREFIMLPGFSTAKVVDNISGRGVGMDVVKTQIFKLGGKVEIQSALNKGSTFTLEVPVNHAIMNGTIIEINEQHFVVPTVNVKEFMQPAQNQWIFTKEHRTMIRVRDNIIPIVPISTFFKDVKEPERVPLVMVLELDQELRAVPITNVINRQEVVVKPVGSEFSHLKYISGMSILGTGKVSLILDIDYLFKKEVKE